MHHLKRIGLRLFAPVLNWAGYFDWILKYSRERSFILMYHRVVDGRYPDDAYIGIEKKHFEDQIRYLSRKMHPVTVRTLAENISSGKSFPVNTIAITFDDGYRDVYDHAFPILKKYEVPATIFITTGFISTKSILWWDLIREIVPNANTVRIFPNHFKEFLRYMEEISGRQVPSLGRYREATIGKVTEWFKEMDPSLTTRAVERLMMVLDPRGDNVERHSLATWEQIREMSDNGIEIGAHTVNHPNLCKLSIEKMEYELRESKAAIENKTGMEAAGFAIPYGQAVHFNEEVIRTAREAGFRYVCTAIPGSVARNDDVHGLRRISIPNAPLPLALWKIFKYA